MSGTLRGVVDIASNQSTEQKTTADIFKAFFDAFEAHPNTTRIALQHGNGGTGDGNGTGRWDSGANSFGNNAFAVWRMEPTAARTWPYYFTMHCQCAGGNATTWGAAPGDPVNSYASTASSTAYIGFQCAIGIGGDQNPWNGTTNNDGTDYRAGGTSLPLGSDGNGQVWRVPASGGTNLLVFPRSNSAGGSYATVKEDMLCIVNHGNPDNARAHLVMDDDCVAMYWDEDDASGSLNTVQTFGIFDPHPNMSHDRPFFQYRAQNVPTTTAANDQRLGGIATPDSGAAEPVQKIWAAIRYFQNILWQPNTAFATGEYDVVPWDLMMHDGRFGFVGTTTPIFQSCVNVPPNSTNAAFDLAVFGNVTISTAKSVFAWTGVAAPQNSSTREGVPF